MGKLILHLPVGNSGNLKQNESFHNNFRNIQI